MRIEHHIGLNADADEVLAFRRIGVEIRPGISSFRILESDPRWPPVSALAERVSAVDLPLTRFDRSELVVAALLGLESTWHHGYPEPSDDFGFREATYDLSDYCENCGSGWRQKAPFRMKKAPVWGKMSIMQLNWIFDEYFVKPEMWTGVFEPSGIGRRPAVLNRSGAEIDTVVQLVVPTIVDIDPEGLATEPCLVCGRVKYNYPRRGFFPKPAPTDAPMFKSTQYFGSGGRAAKLVIVSQELYQAMVKFGMKGVEFSPCRE